MSTSSSKRLGKAVITTIVHDFMGSGYVAMVTGKTKQRSFRVSTQNQLSIAFLTKGTTQMYVFNLTNTVSGSVDQVTLVMRRGEAGGVEITGRTDNYLELANRLALAFAQVYDNVDALGQPKEYNIPGRGYSPSEKDDTGIVSDRARNNKPLGGSSS